MSDEGRCATCRWWGWQGEVAETGDTRACRLLSDWPFLHVDDPGEDMPPAKAYTVPFAGADGATFDTAADFGCVQHELASLNPPEGQ